MDKQKIANLQSLYVRLYKYNDCYSLDELIKLETMFGYENLDYSIRKQSNEYFIVDCQNHIYDDFDEPELFEVVYNIFEQLIANVVHDTTLADNIKFTNNVKDVDNLIKNAKSTFNITLMGVS